MKDNWNDALEYQHKLIAALMGENRTYTSYKELAESALQLRAENAEMREALKPFTKLPCLENFDDDHGVRTEVLAKEIRNARAVLAKYPEVKK